MRNFQTALGFLTVIPIKVKSLGTDKKNLAKSLVFFLIVGLIIGIILSILANILSFMPNLVKSTFILIASIFVTGEIHLEGLANTCDAFYDAKFKEKILQIMKDHRTGVMGTIAIVCILLIKSVLIASIPSNKLIGYLIIMTIFSRWVQSFGCYRYNYARKDGTAKYFVQYARKKDIIIGAILTAVVTVFLADIRELIMLALSLIPVILFTKFVHKKIGGVTGDIIGTTNEIAEICVFISGLIG